MIVIRGSIPIDPAMRDRAISAMSEMSMASEAEAGCVTYRFSFDIREPDTVLLFEEWESEAALAAHFSAPHMATFQSDLQDVVQGEPSVLRYEVSSKGPLH